MTRDGYLKHKHLIEKWGKGEEVEVFIPACNAWVPVTQPEWSEDTEYRITLTLYDAIMELIYPYIGPNEARSSHDLARQITKFIEQKYTRK